MVIGFTATVRWLNDVAEQMFQVKIIISFSRWCAHLAGQGVVLVVAHGQGFGSFAGFVVLCEFLFLLDFLEVP